MRSRSIEALLAAFSLFLLVASCSGSSRTDEIIAEESIYDPGVSVAAVGFDEACEIRLFLMDGQDGLTPLKDGDFVEPGSRTFAIETGSAPAAIDRVLVADGSMYQVEALPQDGRYVCDFTLSGEDLYQAVLIQAVHPGGRASKEKIVLRTASPVPDGAYVRNGVGILAAQELLEVQRERLAVLLDEKIQDLFSYILKNTPSLTADLRYGDDDPYTADVEVLSIEAVHLDEMPSAVLRVRFTIRDVTLAILPLYGQPFLSTASNDLLVDAYVAVDDLGSEGDIRLVLDLVGSAYVSFSQPFFLQGVVEGMIASELREIELPPLLFDPMEIGSGTADLLPRQVRLFGTEKDIQGLVEGLDLDMCVFADIYAVPEATTREMLALGLGLYPQRFEDIAWESPDGNTPPAPVDMQGTFDALFEATIDDLFEHIMEGEEGVWKVTHLAYGDGNPDTRDFTVHSLVIEDEGPDVKRACMQFTLRQVDLEASLFGLLPLITTIDNDLEIRATFSLEHREDETGGWIVLATRSVEGVAFAKSFDDTVPLVDEKTEVEAMVKQELEEMAPRSYGLDELIAGFEIGFGLTGSALADGPYAVFPDVSPVSQDPGWTLALPDTFTLSLAVSQTVINRFLADITGPEAEWDVYGLLVKLLGNDFPGFAAERSAEERTTMRLSVPPAIDLKGSGIRLVVPDVIFQYLISDTPQWEVSVDICLIITPAAGGHKFDIDLSRVPGRNFFHVMKDNPGNLGIFDHSSLADDVLGSLPRLLGGQPGAPFLSLDLHSWEPFIIFEDRDEPVVVRAEDGYLSIDMAASGIDLLQ